MRYTLENEMLAVEIDSLGAEYTMDLFGQKL